jgi:hypothetical protein
VKTRSTFVFRVMNRQRIIRAATPLVAAGLTFAATGCLPYPLQSPRVEPGVTLGGGMGIRPFAPDSAWPNGSRGTFFLPEVTFSPSVGFARADGTGPAFRAGGTFGLPGPFEGDVYGQLPPVGPFIAGVGALFVPLPTAENGRLSAASPYAMIGWQPQDETMFYGSIATLSIHRPTSPESTVTVRVIVIGFQHRQARDPGKGSMSRRAFVALFRGNRRVESVNNILDGGSTQVHSLFVAGFSFDVARPWSWFSGPSRPRVPWPPR